MKDILESVETWRKSGEDIAIATVVETWGSAPRPIGAKMATSLSGGIAGSVSGGCVEGAVIEEGKSVLQSGKPSLLTFGVADEDAWEVGLACGGTIRVFVEPFSALDSVYSDLSNHLAARQPMAVVSVLDGAAERLNRKLIVLPNGSTEGNLVLVEHSERVIGTALEMLEKETGGQFELEDGTTLFVEVYPPVPRLIIVGAVHIADSLVSVGNAIGFDTIVIDPRAAFATPERFPHVKELVKAWPQHVLPDMALDSSAHVVVLTHDPKLDDPALQIALRSKARYVGALGSRRTAQLRAERLRQAGLSEEELSRLHAPVGLPLGGRSPGEIALSILAEIVQVRNGAPELAPAGD